MKKDLVLPPIYSNAGLTVLYRKRLLRLVDDMHASIEKWLIAAYRANEPVNMAVDALPAHSIQSVMRELRRRWMGNFKDSSKLLARYFARNVSGRTDAQLKTALDKGGFSVEFKLTRAQRDIMNSVVHENVSLITSIPEQYLKGVEGAVQRSVQVGRDLESLAKELREQFGVTKRRAAFIARDQNNKATAAFNRSRQLELGVEEAIWQHSSASKRPRPSHVKAGQNKTRYKISEGWWDPDEGAYIWPGVLPNCGCTSRSVIPGFV